MNSILFRHFKKFLMLSALLTLALTGCAIPQFTDQPFKIEQEEFYRTIRVVALEPLDMPEMKQTAEARAEFESLVTEKLKEAGLTVIPSDNYAALLQTLGKQDGGLYDPLTGKKNEAKAKEVQKKIYDELRTQHQIDAVARVVVIPASAHFSKCKARWHGVEQELESCNVFSGGGYDGRIAAVSLLVAIENKEEKTLYMNAGGIQLTARLETGFLKATQFVPTEANGLLVDQLKNRESVAIALGPLIRKQKQPDETRVSSELLKGD